MAKPSQKDIDYVNRAKAMNWDDLHQLWTQIKEGETSGWDSGKAFEHFVVRAFEINGLEVEYPYHVPPGGKPIEQIDGLVYGEGYAFLLECKDTDKEDIDAIAKLRNQLQRRPDTTLGCVFVTGGFTESALVIADFMVPQRILLWSERDITSALESRDFASALRAKYRHLCQYGLSDYSTHYKALKA